MVQTSCPSVPVIQKNQSNKNVLTTEEKIFQ